MYWKDCKGVASKGDPGIPSYGLQIAFFLGNCALEHSHYKECGS